MRGQIEMVRSTKAMLLVGIMFIYSIGLHFKVEAKASSSDIDAKLKLINKPAVKTIKSKDGDIIDCVDIYKQPAFDHPALKNHKIQMTPSFIPEMQNPKAQKDKSVVAKSMISQTWQKSGSCPNETIPIRRIRKKDLLRFNSLDRFGTKPPQLQPFNLSLIPNATNKITNTVKENRSQSYLFTVGYNYIGAEANINVWNPNVDLQDDFTTAQMWLKAGNGDSFESIETGWMVNPKLYGDKSTRIFTYWTKDAYKSTGCFDLTCSGFVQTSTQVALGAAIEPVSSHLGTQYGMHFRLMQDKSCGNWWLTVTVAGKDVPVGYWPAEFFGYLKYSAIFVAWGGEVFSSHLGNITPHTGTQMGSGDEAHGLWGNAAFIQNIRILDYSLTLHYPNYVFVNTDEEYCYGAVNHQKSYGVEPVFYYGGPGQKPPYCP